ncbi:GrpB family protein, partial [Candidatus Jorgensenbacteria bacterium]|nr:GrpB family protein [Candidatus Jorgensenbacteria bacterium]
ASSLKDAEDIKLKLEALGYEYRGEEGVLGRRLYVKGSPEWRTHHLQFVERDSDEWKNHILIREYYLNHPDVAQEYANLKRALAGKYPNDRPSYSSGKNAFIKSVIEKAKKEESENS